MERPNEMFQVMDDRVFDPLAPVCVNLTYKCNWNCSYCISDTHSRYKKQMELFKEQVLRGMYNSVYEAEYHHQLELIKSGIQFCTLHNKPLVISGGEPGLIEPKILCNLLQAIPENKNFQVFINTNGYLLNQIIDNKDLFDVVCKIVDGIRLHLVADVNKFMGLPQETRERILDEQMERYNKLECLINMDEMIDFEFAQVFTENDFKNEKFKVQYFIDEYLKSYKNTFVTNSKEEIYYHELFLVYDQKDKEWSKNKYLKQTVLKRKYEFIYVE